MLCPLEAAGVSSGHNRGVQQPLAKSGSEGICMCLDPVQGTSPKQTNLPLIHDCSAGL
ncbi:hypothetical protein PDJAM_G00095190, partial [Pangasius djambal]|nr:hypothetical protein [Pangasius djambal]